MYEVMDFCELEDYLNEHRPSVIYFSTEDQDWCDPFDSLKMWFAFDRISLNQYPKRICLLNGRNQMYISQIKKIEMEPVSPGFPSVGNILRVTSKDRNGKNIYYKLLVS